MTRQKTAVFIDSCVIFHDFLFRKPASQLLLEHAADSDLIIHIPEVVKLETKNNYMSKIREISEQKRKATDTLNDLQPNATSEPMSDVDFNNIEEQFDKYFDGLLTAYRIVIDSLESVPHKNLVQRALSKRRPFNQKRNSDNGYRDALIWQSILNTASTGQKVVFVTDNWKDFLAKSDKLDLHEDLSQDLSEAKLPANAVRVYRSIPQLVDDLIAPSLVEDENWEQIIQSYAKNKPKLFMQQIFDQIDYSFEAYRYRFEPWPEAPWWFENASIDGLIAPIDFTIDEVYDNDTELFIAGTLMADCSINGDIYKPDAYARIPFESISVSEGLNDRYYDAQTAGTASIAFLAEIAKDLEETRIENIEITGIEPSDWEADHG